MKILPLKMMNLGRPGILSEKHFGEDRWNTRGFCMPRQHAELSAHANARMNEAAAPYLVFYSLGCAIFF